MEDNYNKEIEYIREVMTQLYDEEFKKKFRMKIKKTTKKVNQHNVGVQKIKWKNKHKNKD
jgi:hypothetical protein